MGLTSAFLVQLRPFWVAMLTFCWHAGLWPAMCQPFLCARGAVSLHFNRSHTASSSANRKLQFRGFCPFLSNECVFFLFSFFTFYPFPPSIFLPPAPAQHWLTFTRTQCDLVTLGILCTLICQFGKLICGRMSRSQRSGSWSADLLTG